MADYIPQNPAEQYFYDALWKYANPAGEGELSGKAAVTFFQMSGVDIGILKQIWSLSTPTASMNREQFNSAIRYITMMQQGEIPLSKERLRSSSKVNLGLPKFNGIDIPPYKAPVAAPAINPQLYAITPKDHIKYHELFMTYDHDRDGFLSYDESMNIFRQSGVDPNALVAIYAMSDDDKDTRLTSKEFSVAFHLIICMSKKNLPLPTAIPQMLKGFLLNAPAVPTGGPVPAAATAPVAPAPAAATAVPPAAHAGFDSFAAPALAPAAAAVSASPAAAAAAPAVSGFDAFDSMDIPTSPALPPLSGSDFGHTAAAAPPAATVAPVAAAAAPAPAVHYPTPAPSAAAAHGPSAAAAAPSSYNKGLTYTEKDEYELSQSIDAIKGTTKKSLSSQETLLDANSKAVSSLQGLKQKLHLDKISLEATVNNAHINTQESIARLEATIAEVGQLTEQLKELRNKLDHAQKTQLNVDDRHSKVNAEKAALVRSIEDVMKQLAVANGDVISKTNEANATQHEVNLVKQSNSALFDQESVLKHTAADLSNEIATLKHILGNVTNQRDQALKQVGTAHAKALAASAALKQEKEINSARQGSVSKLNRQVAALKSDKQHLLTEIEHHTDDGDHHYHHDSDAEEAHFGYGDTFEEKEHDSFSKHDSFSGSAPGSASNRSQYKAFSDDLPLHREEEHEHDAFAAASAAHQEDPFSAPAADSDGGFGDSDAFGSVSASAAAAGAMAASSSPSHSIDSFSNRVQPSNTKDGFDDTFSPASGADSFSSAGFDSFPAAASAAPVTGGSATTPSKHNKDPFSSDSMDPFASSGSSNVDAFDSFASSAPTNAAVTGGSGFDDISSHSAMSNKTPAAAATTTTAVGGADAFDSFSATTASTGFDDFSAPTSSKVSDAFDAFGSIPATSGSNATASGSDAFDAFGSTAGPNSTGSGGFDAFGSDPAPSGGSDGFDAFDSSAGVSSGFDAFGAAPASSPAANITTAAAGDAFDAFGSSGNAGASDEDPFASFGSDKAADDPFA